MLDLIKVRRDLHKIPETAYNEHKTQEYILSILKNYPILNVKTFKEHTGIIIEYKGGTGDYKLFRADMDALKITEETNCEFASIFDGYSHSCGHDMHMTILLGLIDKICTLKPAKNFIFVFQPAEEGKGGAIKLFKTGYLDNFKISNAFALHVTSEYPVGTIGCHAGIIFGIPLEFTINICGKPAHAAFPHKGSDALLAAFNFYQTMLNLISKKFNPTEPIIFHVGKIESGKVMNAVSEKTYMEGTIRIFSKENREKIRTLAVKTLKNISELYGCEAEINFPCTYDPVVNSKELLQRLEKNLPNGITMEKSKAKLVGEDFGFYSTRYKALMFWLGTGLSVYDLHHPKFLPKETAIEKGLMVMLTLSNI